MPNQLNFKTRILVIVASLLIVSMLILAVSSYQQLASQVKHDVDKYAQLRMSTNAAKVDNYITQIVHTVEQSTELLVNTHSTNKIQHYLKKVAGITQATDIIVGYETGKGYSHKYGEFTGSSSDPRQRPWYRQAQNQGKAIITDIYQDKTSQQLFITVAAPIYENQTFVGVLAADVAIESLHYYVENATFPGSIAALYDNTGLTIASTGEVDVPGESRLSDFEPLVELENTMLAGKQKMLELELLGIEKIAYFDSIKLTTGTTWHMLVAIDKAAMYKVINDSLITSVMTVLLLLGLSVLVLYFALSYVYKPVENLKSKVHELASGNADLTKRLSVEREDDLGFISRDINRFIEILHSFMRDINDSTQDIDNSVNDLQILKTSNTQSLQSHRQETAQAATALTEMTASSADIASNTESAVDFTSRTKDRAQESKQVVFNATQNMQELVAQVDASSGQIDQMGQEIDNISTILKVIGDIAEQTNLLALNAAIEAARAGEQGRGFAVVADEVRALASRTQDSTSEIYNTINRLNLSSQSVTASIKDTKASCEQASEQTHLVVDRLEQIVDSISGVNDLNLQIATAAQQQSLVSEEINRNMLSVNEVVEQMENRNEQVNQATNTLVNANKNLTNILAQFKI